MSASIGDRKTFLLEGSRLYDAMIPLTKSEVIRRYLAFRIIVNAMSFEDLVGIRMHARFRHIRNVLLAHKQESDFFAGYRAANEITNASIMPLIAFMETATPVLDQKYALPELSTGKAKQTFALLMPRVFDMYHADFLAGFRLINNHLCYTGSSAQEMSSSELAGVFYRYHSSMALFQLAQYIYNNAHIFPELLWTVRHAKLDILLHAQNLVDSVIRDQNNRHSIRGLLEVMTSEGIGNVSSLLKLKTEPKFTSSYAGIRSLRNKLVGHMDKQEQLTSLVVDLDAVAVTELYNFVNMLDRSVFDASQSHIAVRARYIGNVPLDDPSIIDVAGFAPTPYF